VLKKNGTLWLYVDIIGLSQITKKNQYPLLQISKAIGCLAGAHYFTKLDICKAYHRLGIAPGDKWKTAFCSMTHEDMLPDGPVVSHGEAEANPSFGHGLEGLTSAKMLHSAANRNMTQAGMLPDGVAMNRGVTCKDALLHLL
jgi:hypothetical protein